ncbi:Stealth CR1 domain-containing protein [Ligilactobacillus agilis]|uniref:Stealth CR1 domain-containing protein n=1 Tax=Ligilactobacillus agilis TaxID=1601 RepID=UPI000B01060B|nr:Stealth CR1 domain-containing protein [Ligilactobacillus agilis]
MIEFPIDFVVTWVDDTDPQWLEKRRRYLGKDSESSNGMNNQKSYRDWDTFNYWFRGVEKFAPWVNKVYLVTDNQIPRWLNIQNSKLKVIDHKEIIDNKNLPVFNSNAIEANIYKIPNLSEHFVVFNDDTYVVSKVEPTDFFSKDGKPLGRTAISPIVPERYGTANFQINNTEIINDYFSKNEIIKNAKLLSPKQGIRNIVKTLLYRNSKFFCGFWEDHMPMSFLKETYEEVWKKEGDILEKTTGSRFRNKADTNIWLFKDWQFASGNYTVRNENIGKLFSLDDAGDFLWKLIPSGKYKIMCINDGFNVQNIEYVKKSMIEAFDQILPQKSNFEL